MKNNSLHPKQGGLIVYRRRWAREGAFLRRLFPQAFAQAGYFLKALRKAKTRNADAARFLERAQPPLFQLVELETQNRCNGVCSFCPVNVRAPQRPYARMTDALFASIISQLADLRYAGALNLHSNNEPLLDKRLPDFAAHARAMLPKAAIKMITNGTLLTLDLFRTLMPHFDRIFINNYNTTADMHPNIREIHDYCLTKEGERLLEGKELCIQLRSPDAVLSSRAGNAPNRNAPLFTVPDTCPFPFRQFVIRPDGRISLCCQDALGQTTLGDLNEDSIVTVWRGEAFTRVRRTLVEQGRRGLPLCARCDFVW